MWLFVVWCYGVLLTDDVCGLVLLRVAACGWMLLCLGVSSCVLSVDIGCLLVLCWLLFVCVSDCW